MTIPGKCEGLRWMGMVEKMGKSAFGRERRGEKRGPEWRGLGAVQEVFGLCAVPIETEVNEPLQTRQKSERMESRRRWG